MRHYRTSEKSLVMRISRGDVICGSTYGIDAKGRTLSDIDNLPAQ
jgi:hypothetical protein